MKKTLVSGTVLKDLFRFPVLFAMLLGLILSCAQDSIFYDISLEREPKNPRIAGSPTNMAILNSRIYAGTRRGNKIFYYENKKWSSINTVGGSLGNLASDGSHLYVLLFPKGDPLKQALIKRFDGTDWDDAWNDSLFIDYSGYSIETIFCAGGKVFAGGRKGESNYAIFECDPADSSPSFATFMETASPFSGVVEYGAETYLATYNDGVFKYNDTTAPIAETVNKRISGIIETGGILVAVSSNGIVYTYEPGDIEFVTLTSPGGEFTGAMCKWFEFNSVDNPNPTVPSLLLLGRQAQSSSSNQGYRELILDTSGKPTTGIIKTPGEEDLPTSANSKRAMYESSIGKHAVNSILQVPYDMVSDAETEYDLPVFASTAQNGIWSCHLGEWNAEE